jgi:TolB-like protein
VIPKVTEPSHAVFLSYASQDAEAARKICEALRAAGIEVWFDQSELRGGDAWDHRIRQQIRDCALFVPIISQNTQARPEGYFRLEWRLADQRTHLMGRSRAFLVPVCLDATQESDADVPDSFSASQWIRLPAGEASPEFLKRIQQLLSGEGGFSPTVAREAAPALGRTSRLKPAWFAVSVALAAIAAYLIIEKPWAAKSVAFTPPPHSIAVLPFVNMSGDGSQDYFSDGLTEELLNSLAEVNELQVAARTSAFSFTGTKTDIGTIARKLNVGAVLEGSLRRSGNTVRITTQLINGVTGFHIWSHTYDRDLGDVLKLQADIATAVAGALRVTLLADVAAKVELGGTRNPAAFDAYLRGKKIGRTALRAKEMQDGIAAYDSAIQFDPSYAQAYAERSLELGNYASWAASGAGINEYLNKALADARTAISLAPELADGHYAMGVVLADLLQLSASNQEYRRALELAPGSARVLAAYSRHASEMGQVAETISTGRRAIMLDPLNFHVYRGVGIALTGVRQYAEAVTTLRTAISLEPTYVRNYALLGLAHYLMGDFEAARSDCEAAGSDDSGKYCLTLVYQKLGRHADAEALLREMQAASGDDGAMSYACIYAQWGEKTRALQWLETAMHRRDSSLSELKASPELDPVSNEPRFQAIERELDFPS